MDRRAATLMATATLLAVTASVTTTAHAATAPAAAVDCRKVKCVALTFDDGPASYTNRLLGLLKDYDAKATFYVVGQNVASKPDLVRKEAAAGHQIGNHSWNHPDLTKLTTAQIKSQLSRTDKAVKDATGKSPTTLRPPYGAQNAKVRSAAGRPLVNWSVDTLDWKHRDAAKVAAAVKKYTKPGDIVLMHDIHKTTVDAMPKILADLKSRGYRFVTVDQLFAPTKLKAGTVYYNNRGAYRP
ncbi:polysaccharide deacetylase family protein [Streptomyces paludis]|uniref:Hydrolase n=1 Tax=Streptomyces paludis TaxID=2282738 RepID=A0A345HSP8_9ACTN|nr:polysaccharide deacetylase family protein [Streptomyces paludis]AXG79722.1 hydrolase [Streptomyces paludis]